MEKNQGFNSHSVLSFALSLNKLCLGDPLHAHRFSYNLHVDLRRTFVSQGLRLRFWQMLSSHTSISINWIFWKQKILFICIPTTDRYFFSLGNTVITLVSLGPWEHYVMGKWGSIILLVQIRTLRLGEVEFLYQDQMAKCELELDRNLTFLILSLFY